MSDFKKLTQDIATAPLGDIIASVGRGVAEAQKALDESSIQAYLDLYSDQAHLKALRELGYRPTFYTIPKASAEINLAFTISGSSQSEGINNQSLVSRQVMAPSSNINLNNKLQTLKVSQTRRVVPKLYASPVDAGFQNQYNYESKVSAKIIFDVVAIPPSSEIENSRPVPNVVGKTLAQATLILDSLDLNVETEIEDETTVIGGQNPDPTIVVFLSVGETVQLLP
ncbi:PASTA domain-containing protein [Vibrio sp. 1-Bac 57]|uniref:PASTA domain-containing protein n=1 Tax=Psychromonas sp. SA13A TaxID=2686346 RepID=UPI0014089C74|nr:PASTA domain-containing protein [Psychromonas sp. SA13A]